MRAARATQAYRDPEAPREPPPPEALEEEPKARVFALPSAAATLEESDLEEAATAARRPRCDASEEAQPAAPKKAQNCHSPKVLLDFF